VGQPDTGVSAIGVYGQGMLTTAQPMIPRVERQHRLIEELRGRAPRPLTADALAERLGVTARTVERDLAELHAAGVPIRTRRGPGGGYRIDARPALLPIVFTPGEAAGLVAALVTIGPCASATAQSAMAKLLEALCEGGPDE
jgi:predicted DNA-binding transcriptional regulator YafY